MIFSDTLFETYVAIASNKVRSSLTILGIVIGIASVIAMIAIGTGAQMDIQEKIQSIGSNLLMIKPGAQQAPGQRVSQGQGSAQSLTLEDAETIKQNSLVERVAPVSSGSQQVITNGNNTKTSITGTTSDYSQVSNVNIESGSFLTSDHNTKMSKVAVLGPDVVEELFGENVTDVIGKKIRIGGTDFTVIGITESKCSSGFNSADDIIYVPLSTYQQYFSGNKYLSMINIKIIDQEKMTQAEEAIESLLLLKHKIANSDDADFNIMNQSDIVETASSVTGTFTVLLGSVAGISLLVGGIGIMNMMLTTVTERTREIGLRKSIGAKRKDISQQFLIEAGVLTMIGGIVGITLGVLISFSFNSFFGISTKVSIPSIFLAVGVSALIGIAFGYYPARRASKLNPIDALRYE